MNELIKNKKHAEYTSQVDIEPICFIHVILIDMDPRASRNEDRHIAHYPPIMYATTGSCIEFNPKASHAKLLDNIYTT